VSFALDRLKIIGCSIVTIARTNPKFDSYIIAQANSDGLHILRDTRNYGLQLVARSSLS
jgi:hypothetical protein